jgi:hypothetical protein
VPGFEAVEDFIRPEDWANAKAFVTSRARTDFVLDLLAAAEAHAVRGENRVALTEAVTALEAAVSRFMESPNAERLFEARVDSRVRVKSFPALFRQIGKTGTLGCVLPLLFPAERLPAALLEDCNNANADRNNIVHNQQLSVAPDKLARYLASIRKMCSLLREFSDGDAG